MAERVYRALPHLFLLFALITGALVALSTPPFMGADEQNHTYRAGLLTFGRLVAQHVPLPGGGATGGGPVDKGVAEAAGVFQPLKFHAEVKATAGEFTAARRADWRSPPTMEGFQNTAVYGPLLYLPQSLALGVGKVAGLSVVDTLYLARLANVLACGLIGWLALRIAGRAGAVLFAVLLLPMATFLYGTVTQDGMVIVLAALACALILRSMTELRSMTAVELWAAAGCFALIAMARPHYAVFGLVLLVVPSERGGRRWAAAVFPLVVAALWGCYMAYAVFTSSGVEARQLDNLMKHPAVVGPLAFNTLTAFADDYATQFVGVLGWLDTLLPGAYYPTALTITALAGWLIFSRTRPAGWRGVAPAVVAACVLALAGIFFTLYLEWTPFAFPRVEGVQGRYFIPIVLMLSLALAGAPPPGPRSRWILTAGLLVVAAFPAFSFWIVQHALTLRYFGGQP